jgi:hypothetical protein
VELYLHSPNTLLWRGAHLKHTDNFTFTIVLGESEDSTLEKWKEASVPRKFDIDFIVIYQS